MKRCVFPVALIVAALFRAFAQASSPPVAAGTNATPSPIEFTCSLSGTNEVLPNSSTATGSCTFVLRANVLRYEIFVPLPISPPFGQIHGPARPGENAQPMFALDGPLFEVPFPEAGDPGGYAWFGTRALSSKEITQLRAGLWYLNILTADYPQGELRGQLFAVGPDNDGDAVPDDLDACPNTPPGAVVNGDGCSIDQLCPCDGKWRNHGEYVRCVLRTAKQFQGGGLITAAQRRAVVRQAIRSDCGKHRRPALSPTGVVKPD